MAQDEEGGEEENPPPTAEDDLGASREGSRTDTEAVERYGLMSTVVCTCIHDHEDSTTVLC